MAIPTSSTVFVNNAEIEFEAYYIDGYNYFKLRDLAYALNGTEKQFEVQWNEATGAIDLLAGQPYTSINSEMMQGVGAAKEAFLNASIDISFDGYQIEITAYLIEGSNYVRLRDVMRQLDVYVGYDEVTRNIIIDTSRMYED